MIGRNRVQRITLSLAIVGGMSLALFGCSRGDEDIQPGKWTCEKLVQPVIDMSKDKELKVLEITDPSELPSRTSEEIECRASAEWSHGEGWITYGAHVSDGGRIVLQYKQGI